MKISTAVLKNRKRELSETIERLKERLQISEQKYSEKRRYELELSKHFHENIDIKDLKTIVRNTANWTGIKFREMDIVTDSQFRISGQILKTEDPFLIDVVKDEMETGKPFIKKLSIEVEDEKLKGQLKKACRRTSISLILDLMTGTNA